MEGLVHTSNDVVLNVDSISVSVWTFYEHRLLKKAFKCEMFFLDDIASVVEIWTWYPEIFTNAKGRA